MICTKKYTCKDKKTKRNGIYETKKTDNNNEKKKKVN